MHVSVSFDIRIALDPLPIQLAQKTNRTSLWRLRLTTTTTTSNAGIKDKELASRSKAARDFGTAWRAVVPGRKDDCGEKPNLVCSTCVLAWIGYMLCLCVLAS